MHFKFDCLTNYNYTHILYYAICVGKQTTQQAKLNKNKTNINVVKQSVV